MKHLRLYSGIIISLFSINLYADIYSADGNITGMFSGKGNIVGVFHSGAWFNPAGCPNGANDHAYIFNYDSSDDWNKVHSMLLAAYISKSSIKIAPHPTECFAGYPTINRVAYVKGY